MDLTTLFTDPKFYAHSVAVAVLIQALKSVSAAYYPKDKNVQRHVKALLGLLSLVLGAVLGIPLAYAQEASVNLVIGLIAGAFSTQAYTMIKRYLPPGWSGEPASEEPTEEKPKPPAN